MGEATKKDDEKLIPVGPGAEGLETPEPEKEEAEKSDARLANEPDEKEDDKEEAKRKESPRSRRERAKRARDRERVELNFYAKRNEELEKRLMQLEGRTAQNEGAAIDQRITSIKAQLANADAVIREALKKPNGAGADDFVEAQRIRDELRDQLNTLTTSKQTHEQRTKVEREARDSQVGQSVPRMERPDPKTLRYARDWADQHDWFDFQGTDEDSVIVRAIDESLAGDGFDPSTPEYWEELTSRVKRRLPERFKNGAAAARADEDDDDVDDVATEARPKTGPKFSSGGRERPLKKGEVYVSAERKEAMKQYGVWDDPVARNRMLKKYAQWDAELAASKR